MRELKITPIKNGTVIDHITSGFALEVLRIIGANNLDKESTVSVALHVRSRRMGWKDIVKVENMELSPQKVNAIALLSPTATISMIHDFKVMVRPPSRCMAVSKESRVRVDGSKKARASNFPSRRFEERLPSATGICFREADMMDSISSFVRSLMETRSRPLSPIPAGRDRRDL